MTLAVAPGRRFRLRRRRAPRSRRRVGGPAAVGIREACSCADLDTAAEDPVAGHADVVSRGRPGERDRDRARRRRSE